MGSGARILVVDDDADMLHLISLRLTAAGYQVSEAESGEAALLSFRENRPQLVVTDLRMGEMDGLALFEHLQAEAQTLPVIILTAHGTIPDAVAATQRGVFSFLTKPFDGRELLRRVADAIRLSPILDPEHAAARWRSGLVTVSVRMEDLLRQALRISEESKTALLVGTAGSRKDHAGTNHSWCGATRWPSNGDRFMHRFSRIGPGRNAVARQCGRGLCAGRGRLAVSAGHKRLVAGGAGTPVFGALCTTAGQ